MTIDGILDAADHATSGPWKCVGDGIFPEASLLSIARICNAHSAVAGVEAANGALICGSHTLAAEVRRLREENETGRNMYSELWENVIRANKDVIRLRERERVLVDRMEVVVEKLEDCDQATALEVARAALEAVKE